MDKDSINTQIVKVKVLIPECLGIPVNTPDNNIVVRIPLTGSK
jgi:hypothetical protein